MFYFNFEKSRYIFARYFANSIFYYSFYMLTIFCRILQNRDKRFCFIVQYYNTNYWKYIYVAINFVLCGQNITRKVNQY